MKFSIDNIIEVLFIGVGFVIFLQGFFDVAKLEGTEFGLEDLRLVVNFIAGGIFYSVMGLMMHYSRKISELKKEIRRLKEPEERALGPLGMFLKEMFRKESEPEDKRIKIGFAWILMIVCTILATWSFIGSIEIGITDTSKVSVYGLLFIFGLACSMVTMTMLDIINENRRLKTCQV